MVHLYFLCSFLWGLFIHGFGISGISNSSIWPIHRTLTGIITPIQSRPGSNSNKGEPPRPHILGENFTLVQGVQSAYSKPQCLHYPNIYVSINQSSVQICRFFRCLFPHETVFQKALSAARFAQYCISYESPQQRNKRNKWIWEYACRLYSLFK